MEWPTVEIEFEKNPLLMKEHVREILVWLTKTKHLPSLSGKETLRQKLYSRNSLTLKFACFEDLMKENLNLN